MKFDFTHGNEPKYQVSIYGWNVSDYVYYDKYDLKKARQCFIDMVNEAGVGDFVSLEDMDTDEKLAYYYIPDEE